MNRSSLPEPRAAGDSAMPGAAEKVFAEPWQAQAFAIAVRLSDAGEFSWKEWTEILGREIQSACELHGADDGSRYYELWLAALERMAIEKGLVNAVELSGRKAAWVDAYLTTPHGHPVHLHQSEESNPSAGPVA